MTDPTHDAAPAGPYAASVDLYRTAGWQGTLPLPHGRKWPPPDGYTGGTAPMPSGADVYAWLEDGHGRGNIALRLPHHIIGVDVDAYAGKAGAATLHQLEQTHGPLPATWRVTSRDDGVSGIRLYRVPEGLAWPGVLGPGIETVRHGHRYAVTWPSIHPEGGTYRWIGPDGLTHVGVVPHIDQLPDLPPAWVQGVTGGQAAVDIARAGLTTDAARSWLDTHGGGQPCRAVQHVLTRASTDLLTPGGGASRHDTAMAATARLAHLAADGHTGTTTALNALRTLFDTATAGERRDPSEWARLVAGAVDIAAAAGHDATLGDPCTDPMRGLTGPRPSSPAPAGLDIRRNDGWTPPSPPAAPTTAPAGSATPAAPSAASTASPTPPSAAAASLSTPSSESTPSSTRAASAPGSDALTSTADVEPAAHTSWWPRDLTAVISGDTTDPAPVHLTRTDGASLFYAGKVNGLIAASESGKTWVALHAVVQALDAGDAVLYLDGEDSATGIVGRLLKLGARHLLDRFAYADPDTALDPAARNDLTTWLEQHPPQLIIVDGVNAFMTLMGLDLNSNTDATVFAQAFLKPLSNTGATVVYIDHVAKNNKGDETTAGGIGAQAKRAMTTGCALRVDAIQQPAPGQVGRLKLTVDKDRAGHVRAVSTGGKTAAMFTLDATASSGQLAACLDVPVGAVDAATGEQRPPQQPTVLMGRVSQLLEQAGTPLPGSAIEAGVSGKGEYVRKALQALVDAGHVRVETVGRARMHELVTPYHSPDADPLGEVIHSPTPAFVRSSPIRPYPSRDERTNPDPAFVRSSPPSRGGRDGTNTGAGVLAALNPDQPIDWTRARVDTLDDGTRVVTDTTTGEVITTVSDR